ncbi:hypothetical protein SAMN03159341_101555 [Paenibacillus sp. 1_12]|nr:hypothetical protein SAMN03159341_101555 [Paenibacillus sp. 1_12]
MKMDQKIATIFIKLAGYGSEMYGFGSASWVRMGPVRQPH